MPALKAQTSAGPSLLRRLNERAIFEHLLIHGSASRSDLMRALGVTAPTIHKAVASLVEAGLVEEAGMDGANRVGRPGVVYRVASASVQVIGAALDVRRTNIVRAGLDGVIDRASSISFDMPTTYEALLDELERSIRSLLRTDVQTIGVGLSVPGEIDTDDQRILLSPNLHIIDGKTLSSDLEQRLKLDTVMYHETTGTCLAEWTRGAGKGLRSFVQISVYEGYGASIVSDGRLLAGRDGMGGEMGHVTIDLDGLECGCGNRGCIETVATDQAFARRVSKRLGKSMSVEAIIDAARTGEIDVRPELDETFKYLAVGVAAAINIFNPEAVLISSRMFDLDAGALDRLADMSYARAQKPLAAGCQIVRAAGDTRDGAIASIIHHISGSIGPLF